MTWPASIAAAQTTGSGAGEMARKKKSGAATVAAGKKSETPQAPASMPDGFDTPAATVRPKPAETAKPVHVHGCFYLIIPPTLLFAIGILLLTLTHPGRTAVATLFFLPQAFPQTGPTPIEYVTDPPERREVTYGPNGAYVADVYLPTEAGLHGAAIFYLGIQPIERRDPALVRLADGLARLGLVVLVPELPSLYSGQLNAGEVDVLVESVRYLRGHEAVNPERIGMSGFSAGASLMLLAASDPRVNDQVDWVNSFGGYYDAHILVREVLGREFILADGTRRTWIPADLTLAIVRRQLIEGLPSREDRVILTNVFFGNRQASPADLAGLSEEGRALYRLLTATTGSEVSSLMTQLPPAVTEALATVSPRRTIDQLRAFTFVMHDRNDPYIPFVQSRDLVRALPPEQVLYTEFSLFEHVEPNRNLDPIEFVTEIGKLFGHLYAIFLRALDENRGSP